jgi:hypothetical protein
MHAIFDNDASFVFVNIDLIKGFAYCNHMGDLWRSGLAPVSAAGNECAAGSAVVRTTVAANFQTGMRRLMNRSSGVFSEYFGFLPSLSW